MSARVLQIRPWLILVVILAVIGWWYSPVSPRVPPVAALAPGTTPACPPPPAVTPGDAPLQSRVPASMPPFALVVARLQPLAGFSLDARVLSRRDYSFGRESKLSPTDLALGWGRMATPGMAKRLSVSQSSRWYRYRWTGHPPLPPREMARSSANMHMIPSDQATSAALHHLRAGERVRIDGWLVEADGSDGWQWRSSLSRKDTGDGACELVYVCSIVALDDNGTPL